MAPATVHLNAQLIRHGVEATRAIERWLQGQPASETRAEGFRAVRFWEQVWQDASRKLAAHPREPKEQQ